MLQYFNVSFEYNECDLNMQGLNKFFYQYRQYDATAQSFVTKCPIMHSIIRNRKI